MTDESNLPVEPEALVEPEIPATAVPGQSPMSRPQKARDFMIGFFGGLALNVILYLSIYALQSISEILPDWLIIILGIIGCIAPWVLNFGLITLALVLKRKWIVFGVLSLIVIPILLTILFVVIFMVACLAGGLEGL